ncbi:hypothetical protein M8J75_004671 [Diaphorina citri]|nr:hypothetical protein M8J75_004671 [Diaphorina citri]
MQIETRLVQISRATQDTFHNFFTQDLWTAPKWYRAFDWNHQLTKPIGSSLLNYPTGFGLSQCPTKPIGSSLVNYPRGFGLSQCAHQALGGFGLSPRYSTKPIGSCLLISQRLCLLTRLSVIKPLRVGVSLSGATNINPPP